jgi:hypothetical protein
MDDEQHGGMLPKKFIRKPYAGKPHVRIDEGKGRLVSTSLLYRAFETASTAEEKETVRKKNWNNFAES